MPALDYYATLGVSREASDDDVKKAYRQLVLRYHPDRNPGDPSAEVKIREINAAYEVLGDPETRRSYERLRFGPAQETWREETVDPSETLQAMEIRLADEARKELFAILMKDVPKIKVELALIRERTLAQQGYDTFNESVLAGRAREVMEELIPDELRERRRRLLDVALRMMVTGKVVGERDEGGQRRVRADLEEAYRRGMIAGYMSALELFYVRK